MSGRTWTISKSWQDHIHDQPLWLGRTFPTRCFHNPEFSAGLCCTAERAGTVLQASFDIQSALEESGAWPSGDP